MMTAKTLIRVVLLVAILATTVPAQDQTYVSLKGEFHITYPQEWAQVDYWLVDAFLRSSDTARIAFDYDAVFAVKDAPQFFSREYLILSVDTVGELREWQIDSVLIDLVGTFGNRVRHQDLAEFLSDPELEVPCYDTLMQTVAIISDIVDEQQVMKKNLLLMKFYERGIATFYCYAPDSIFQESQIRFLQIVASFSTENIENAFPREQVRIADLEDNEDEGKKSNTIFLFAGVAVVLILLALLRRRRKA
jgi:LPXTG-motif cell wall-anchored protein